MIINHNNYAGLSLKFEYRTLTLLNDNKLIYRTYNFRPHGEI